MTDSLFQVVLSNAALALALAIVALVVGAILKRPQLAHLLWLLVLVKLLTPPVMTIPVITIPEQSVSTVVSLEDYSQPALPLTSNLAERWFALLDAGKNELSLIWLLVSMLVFSGSLARIYRFNRLLGLESEAAPQELQTAAAGIADRLGIKAVPTIYTTAAQISPMVWWIGGNVRVMIPAPLHDQMDSRQLQWILAHELAHVRRRDYLVRCIEWLACVCFWWNPVMWWARYNLRVNEELCCDALVVSSLKPKPHAYGDSLAKAVEYLAYPTCCPPAIASEINSGGFLKRRFKMIVSDKIYRPNSRWLQAGVLSCALAVLVLG
ncbi:MAG: M56 family metallopeptidase, partial [Fidelibacterota bacterium]